MKLLVTIDVCDLCHDADPDTKTPGVKTRTITLDNFEPREMVICHPHDEKLHRLLAGVASRPSVVRQSAMWPCPVCLETVRRGGATLHLWRHTSKGRAPLQPKRCPTCKKAVPDPRGMSRHRQNVHGWDGLAEALAAAERERKPIRNTGPGQRDRAAAASKSSAAKRTTAKV